MSSDLAGPAPTLASIQVSAVANTPSLSGPSDLPRDPPSVKSALVSSQDEKSFEGQAQSEHTTSSSLPPPKKGSDMDSGPLLEVRELVRLAQCKQCSRPLRTPMTFPCGNSLCAWCLPERHKRENISFPLLTGRGQGFLCPFPDCRKEHSIADCAQDVTLTKITECLSNRIADYHLANPETPLQLDEQPRIQTNAEKMQAEVVGSGGLEPRSRTLNGGFLAATYTMAELGELRYDSDVAYVLSNVTTEAHRALDTTLFNQLSQNVRQELDCQLCWNLLYDPLTTPCGHTFCRACVARILDHSTTCPVCRKTLHLPPGVQREPTNKLLRSFLETYCAEDLAVRKEAIKAESEEASKWMPLFVCTLGYPGMPTFLHIFEPRYRLMIRRALETESRTFGMVAYNASREPQGEGFGPNALFMRHGTLLQIVRVAPIQDGRIIIECIGVSRFSVKEFHEQDGYLVAQTDRIEDIGLEEEEALESEQVSQAAQPPVQDAQQQQPSEEMISLNDMSTADLFAISVDFVTRMQEASAPWLNSRIMDSYGQPPFDNPRLFPFWFASVVPFAETEKYVLLGTTSVRERLKITARWVKTIESQRW